MPSTYTDNLGIEKIATGEQSGTWGDTTNLNFDMLDQAVNGLVSVTLASAGSSGSPNGLAITDGVLSNGRNKWIEFVDGGDLGATAYVQLTPSDAAKIVYVRNSLSGSRSIILFQGTYDSARDLEVPAGVDMVVKFDGTGAVSSVTNVFQKLSAVAATLSSTLDVTGTVTLSDDLGVSRKILVSDPDQDTGNLRDSQTTTDRTASIQINATNGPNAGVALVGWNSGIGGYYSPQLWLAKSNASDDTVGTNTIVSDGTDLGAINFAGNDGTTFYNAASIRAEIDGTPSAGSSMPGRLVFYTTPSGATAPQEVMRIDASGDITVSASATIDGRDVSADGSKLDGIESGATADQTITAGTGLSGGGTGNVTINHAAHTGDVTGATTLTIANDAVTYAKMQNVAGNNVLLGNNSGAGGIVDELTAAEVRTILNVEDGADVTDTANVTAAGALMDSELTNLAAVKAINQQLTTTSSPTFAAIQTNGDILVRGGGYRTTNLRDSQTTSDRAARIQANDTAGPGASAALISWHSNGGGYYSPQLWLAKSNASDNTVGTNTIVSDGTDLGAINFAGNDGTRFFNAASIRAEIDGTPSAGSSMPGRLVFYTTASGNTAPSEAMRIDNSGNLGVQTSTPAGALDVNGTVYMGALNTTALGANMRVLAGGQVVESTSSLRYKTDIEDANDTISEAVIYDSRPIWYRSLAEADPDEWSFWGFLAEELHEIDPRLVSYQEDENGDLIPDGVQYDRFTVHLVNVAQKQKAQIEDLERRLGLLEAQA